jgi:6-pyruvoyltetrahydropterin/6-carboxytetrahydropterin synthase
MQSPSSSFRHRIYLGKDFHKFSCAHMTVFSETSKERLHGHNFRVSVAVDVNDVSLANMLDFAWLKREISEQCLVWDQRLLLAKKCPYLKITSSNESEIDFTLCGKRYVIPIEEVLLLPVDNVIVETLAECFAHAFVERLGSGLKPEVVQGLLVDVCESNGQGGVYHWTWPERA